MKKALDFIVYSNLFIALCTALFTWQTLLVFSVEDMDAAGYIIVNFISTFILYNLQRLHYSAKTDTDKYNWYNIHRRLIFTLIVLLVLLSFNFTWYFFIGNKKAIFSYLFLSAVSLLYFLPPFQLRRFGILKPFLIAFIFVFTGILLPTDFLINPTSLFYCIGQFAFIAALCILFDLRDMAHDKSINVNTFPVKFGEKKIKIILMLLLLVYLSFSLAFQNKYLMFPVIITFLASCLLTFFANSKRPHLYYAVLVDGMILLQALLVIF